MTDGSPRARRNRATLDCRVFGLVVIAAWAHRSSMSRSNRTSAPASTARRTSSSEVLPPGTGTASPSWRTSIGPSTETWNTC